MLRRQLGDEAFFKGIRSYYKDHASGNASTEDLRAALERSSGKSLKEFFARWVYGAGHPRYELTWSSNARGSITSVRLNQLQAGDPFLDPVPVEFTINGKPDRRTIFPKAKSTTIAIKLPGKPTAASVDPDETLLKEIVKTTP